MASMNNSVSLASNEALSSLISTTVPTDFINNSANIDIVRSAETLMSEWMGQIDKYISGVVRTRPGPNGESGGPRTELELWRNRMNQIDSIVAQIHGSNHCKFVIQILTALGSANVSNNLPLDMEKERLTVTSTLIRKWKQTEISLNESLNEARDNVKYLSSLDKYLEPMYTGTPEDVIEIVPALMNAFHMMNSISKYYSGSVERMTMLISKITNQMIQNCMDYIVNSGSGTRTADLVWWDDQPQSRSDLISRLRSCIELNEKYQSGYKASLSNQSASGSTTTLNQISLFGKFDLFCRRLTKLVDLFSVISQFDELSRRRIDGMDKIMAQFVTLRENFRLKRHDFLDYHDNKFDRDYVEFVNGIGQVDKGLCEFVVFSLGEISSNIEGSLGLVRKYKIIFSRRPSVAKILDEESLQ
jgi:dynein heavy chain